MKIRTLFLLLTVSLLPRISLPKNDLDDPDVRAAIAVLEAKNDLERNYQLCPARAGDYGYKYDYIKYIWDLKNRPYIQVAEKIFGGLATSSSTDIQQRWKRNSDKLLSGRSNSGNDEIGKYCSQYFSLMINGPAHDLRVSRESLWPKLGSREEVRILERNTDMEVGCVKAGYNEPVEKVGFVLLPAG